MPRLPLLLIGSALLVSVGVARAQPELGPELSVPEEEVVETHAVGWPLMLDIHALIGVEPQTQRGSPIAFGAGAELLWRGRIGGFAELLSSEGTALIVPTLNGVMQPGFADRISIPFGLAARPLARWFVDRSNWLSRLASGFGVQAGISIEYLRTSDDDKTTAGLHLAVLLDVPLYGGPKQSGVAIRLYARLVAAPSVHLDANTVFEPNAIGQLFAGLVYIP